MTIDQMRLLLGLGPEFSDAAVVQAYGEYLAAGGAGTAEIELIPLSTVKKHLGLEVDDDEQDELVAMYLAAAIDHLDGANGNLGHALRERVYIQTFERLEQRHRLPFPPLVAVTGVEIWRDAAWLPISAADWTVVDGALAPLAGCRWPTGRARVAYRAGYDPAAGRPLPKALQSALLLMAGSLFRNRDETAASSMTKGVVDTLLSNFRAWRV